MGASVPADLRVGDRALRRVREYGYLLWLNTNRTLWPSTPESAYAFLGHGQNVVWIDSEHDLVVVLRWLDLADDRDEREAHPNQDRFFEKLLAGV